MEPKVRFKNSGIWLYEKVGNICDLLTGFPFPGDKIVLNGNTLLLRGINITEGVIRHSKEIDRYYNESTIGFEKYRLEVGDLVVGMDGSKVGKNSALITSKEQNSLLVQRVARLRHEDKNLINLIQIGVGSRRFIKYVEEIKTSSAIPHISSDDIRNFIISLPKDSVERQFIAGYFTSLDSLIVASNSHIASLKKLKAASLISMFPQNGESTPKVRFKGFEGEWRRIKFGTISSRVTRRNDTLECKFPLTISANEGLISQEKFFNNIVASSNLGNYYLLKRGEFAYNKSYSNGYPFGAIKRLDKYDSGVLSPLYICFGIHDEVDSDYICFFFETTLWHKDVAERATEGARNHGILNIGTEDFFDINIMIPKSKEEQQSIATFFRSLDRKIALETARLEKLKQIKLACLDKMFV